MTALRRFGLALALGTSACATLGLPPITNPLTRYYGTVNGLGEMEPPATFIVLPGNPGTDTTDLQFLEVRGFTIRALVGRGFVQGTLLDADVAVFVRYGIGAPQNTVYTKTSDVYGFGPSSTTTTTGTVTGSGGSADVSATSTTQGGYGVVGTRTTAESRTSYTRWYELSGVLIARFRQDGSIVEGWRTSVVSEGSSGDIRRVLPYLIVQATPYIAKRTQQGVQVTVWENDSRVAALRAP